MCCFVFACCISPVFRANNYRGVHLTAQVAKAVERLLLPLIEPVVHASMLEPVVLSPLFAGPVNYNQFAYQKGKGARDASLPLALAWIRSLDSGRQVAAYGSDLSGAFDKVPSGRLNEKLSSLGLHEQLVQFVKSWLRCRCAEVVVSRRVWRVRSGSVQRVARIAKRFGKVVA